MATTKAWEVSDGFWSKVEPLIPEILYKLYRASPLVIHCFPRIQIRLYATSGRYQGVTLTILNSAFAKFT